MGKVYCACGCGQVVSEQVVKRGGKYAWGHHMRNHKLRQSYAGRGKCQMCGKEFTRNAHNQIYCQDCRLKFRTCPVCGKVAKDNGQNEFHLCKDCDNKQKVGEYAWIASPAWKGGRHVRPDGYIGIYAPDHPRAKPTGYYVMEHILVWEQANERYLPKGWVIHHMNGVRDDNRIENLLAMPKSTHDRYIPALKKRIRELESTVFALSNVVMAMDIEV